MEITPPSISNHFCYGTAASLQVQKGIRPIIFDYDQTTRVLTVVDRSFLIWLAHQNLDDLMTDLGIT